MTVRRVARFRPIREQDNRNSGRWTFVRKGLLRILDLLAVSMVVLLVVAPFVWRKMKADKVVDAWTQPRMSEISRVEKDWMTLPRLPDFSRGDEPVVREFLKAEPLVLALRSRSAPRTLWIRRDDILTRAEGAPEAAILDGWFSRAEKDQVFISLPADILPGEARSGPKVVLQGDRWAVAKAWREGSPEVEQFLRNHFGPTRSFRVVLLKDGDEARKDLKPQPWGAEPHIQGDPYWGVHSAFSVQLISNEFPGWTFTVIPFRAEGRAIQLQMRLQFALAAALALLVGLSLVLGLWLRARARRKATLDADRMASMTHSLKTPLAILKFRCDTLRLGRLPPDQLDSQLIQIGEEADRLSAIIENALMAIQGPAESGPQQAVSPQWVQGVAEDLAPAFEAENRRLVLKCTDQAGKAALPSLRAALFTLVENALFHGAGTVTVETSRVRKRFLIKVSDQGPGLDAMDMRTLGRPFMRIRERGKEGFRKEGQGLGLSLLIKVVEREGWGLTFASEPGRGLCATLEIQTASQ
ncbi:sensor histidine kinase [Mesoterricola silvestris]|uniref:histidine kinase n=1 Tax=Mesoterricola silvestris TaxID=2927979 RepID=A0AA48K874_9BACT|nr:HAMP domain-containing sensor histidine kinase [Mesoterricola silvestris]BDU72649.1 hypothetical protein METEAL_18230 [Mesoterricola silvestris]